ncbi:hypothetical protein K6V66_05105 [Ralstonia mannitolilytica]|nr:hypothetical protein [Ralstonia mannitolilytica]
MTKKQTTLKERMMSEFSIEVNMNARFVVTIQAEDKDEAETKALDMATEAAWAIEHSKTPEGYPNDVEFQFNSDWSEVGWIYKDGEELELQEE